MTIRFNNLLRIDAPIDTVWAVLTDIPVVLDCMPGVRLDELTGENCFHAVAKLKVGPMKLEFSGDGELYDVAETNHFARLKAQGRDRKGRGNFQLEMSFKIEPNDLGSDLYVDTDLTLGGSIAQFGRTSGLAKEIAKQIMEDFGVNLALVLRDRIGRDSYTGSEEPSQSTDRKNEEHLMDDRSTLSVGSLLYSAIKNRIRGD